MFRVGIGYDVHALKPGLKLMLGCVFFEEAKLGLEGHSDADVVTHAVCDALLGAVGLGDMGDHFPDTDPAYENFPGTGFLERVAALVKGKGYNIENVDCVVSSDAILLKTRKKDMSRAMAEALGVNADQINVKATTHEGYGAVGRGEIIACEAIALVTKAVQP